MKKFGISMLAAALLLGMCLPLLAQEDVDENTVIRVLQTSYPKLEAKQIQIEMIKNLTNRVKVNLKVLDTPAIVYLTWQRYRNQYRWWYERGERNSLVFLDKRPPQLSRLATISRPRDEPEMETPAAQAKQTAEPRVETIEFDKEKKQPPVMKSEAEPKPETEKKSAEIMPTEKPKEMPAAKPAEPKKEMPPAEEPVKKEEAAPKPESTEMKPEMKKEPEPERKSGEAMAKKEEPKKPEAKPAAEEKTAKEKEAAREELQEELNKMAPSAKKEIEESKPVLDADAKGLVPEPEPLKKADAQPKQSEVKPEKPAEEQQSPFLPVPLATGPAATAQEFLSTLVMIIGKGEEGEYANFLFRPSEMAVEVQERDFQRAVDIWSSQFDVVHQQLKNAGHIEIRRILLQLPQTPELERTTRASLQRQVKSVLKVYNYVKIDLAIDGQPAYITIGGLVQTEGGWRVAGRIELVKQITVQ